MEGKMTGSLVVQKSILSTVQSWPGNLICTGMKALNEYLFFNCLSEDGSSNSDVFQYSPDTDTWTKLMELDGKRYKHQLVTLNDQIYVIDATVTGTLECYNYSTNQWTHLAPVSLDSSYLNVTTHQNKIYFLSRNVFKEFNPEINTWKFKPHPTQSSDSELISMNDKLLILSPQKLKSECLFEFDTINNSWYKLCDVEDTKNQFIKAVIVNF